MNWFSLAASPAPTTPPGFNEDLVTPGIWGFVLTIGVIIAVILLIIDMVRRIRRVNYRAQVQQQLADEEAAKTKS